ncbi:MAG: DNA topoisomerase VI subunit B [Candidatus Woesearchaeota archaeon]|nr:MAG: DNA topoisomerase VI subunit B [Candidatus Woesearchaeota archaeon]
MTTTKAHELAKGQREISIAEFFEKNRHLLGFDNKRKALLTTVKEAVDNSLDACEEANILPDLQIEIVDMGNDRFRIIVEDNGPGIVREQIPKIFAKLLYGSKFFKYSQSRGQQGIGISASVMYGQLTTGRAAKILSKIHPTEPAHYYELKIDTKTNAPQIDQESKKDWNKDHGTKIQIDLEGFYQKGQQSVDEYIKETAIVNPHANIIYVNPRAEQYIFPRASEEKIPVAKEIKPHPYGVELGRLMKMCDYAVEKNLKQFLMGSFSRVSASVADELLEKSKLLPTKKPKSLNREDAERLLEAIKTTKIMMPPTDCISPIGEDLLLRGLKKEINAEFYAAVSRPPAVYRGNPFAVEVALAYGGALPKDGAIRLMRFANRVPLLFQQGACGVTDSVTKTSWKSYGLNQSGSNMPVGPAVVIVHLASVWVPFTSEAKEAIAHYPEILKEVKLALQELGRKLSKYTAKKRRVSDELKKRGHIEKYIPHIAGALESLLGLTTEQKAKTEVELAAILEHTRGKVEDMTFDPKKNEDFDEEFARIGKEDEHEESS